MEKINISLNNIDANKTSQLKTLGMNHILGSLMRSEKFNISFHDKSINAFRGQTATLIYVNNKKIYLDFWEYATPTYTSEVYNENFDLIIKLQHKNFTNEHLSWFCKRKNILSGLNDSQREDYLKKIIPFTFFPSRTFEKYIGRENEIDKLPHENMGFFCGKGWRCRNKTIEILNKEGIECIKSDQAEVGGKPITDEEFLRKMKVSKYGIVLAGRSTAITDAKNRREIDYMMLRKPLLLNYKPFYYNPLVEGKHYIYIDANTDFKNLDKMYNMEEIVSNATDWYNKNATPNGIANTFEQILIEKGII